MQRRLARLLRKLDLLTHHEMVWIETGVEFLELVDEGWRLVITARKTNRDLPERITRLDDICLASGCVRR